MNKDELQEIYHTNCKIYKIEKKKLFELKKK